MIDAVVISPYFYEKAAAGKALEGCEKKGSKICFFKK